MYADVRAEISARSISFFQTRKEESWFNFESKKQLEQLTNKSNENPRKDIIVYCKYMYG